jgi:putative addiction module component (TIGR02574 family)
LTNSLQDISCGRLRLLGVVRQGMAISRDCLFQEALALEPRERAELATLLIDSLDPETEQAVEEAWMREIDRRAAEVDSGAIQTIPWDVARARLRRSTRG